jgi:tetratricopeptide (TPR) repeat protein
LQIYEVALYLCPTVAKARYHQGFVYHKLGEKQAAIKSFAHAAMLLPNFIAAKEKIKILEE